MEATCQILTVDRAMLRDRTGKLTHAKLELVMAGLEVVLGRSLSVASLD